MQIPGDQTHDLFIQKPIRGTESEAKKLIVGDALYARPTGYSPHSDASHTSWFSLLETSRSKAAPEETKERQLAIAELQPVSQIYPGGCISRPSRRRIVP